MRSRTSCRLDDLRRQDDGDGTRRAPGSLRTLKPVARRLTYRNALSATTSRSSRRPFGLFSWLHLTAGGSRQLGECPLPRT